MDFMQSQNIGIRKEGTRDVCHVFIVCNTCTIYAATTSPQQEEFTIVTPNTSAMPEEETTSSLHEAATFAWIVYPPLTKICQLDVSIVIFAALPLLNRFLAEIILSECLYKFIGTEIIHLVQNAN